MLQKNILLFLTIGLLNQLSKTKRSKIVSFTLTNKKKEKNLYMLQFKMQMFYLKKSIIKVIG